jgi:organic radical activating enzyme
MSKINLNQLEIHISEICNLRCIGCTSFSDYKIDHDYESWKHNKKLIESWGEKLNISCIAIAGGEPLMHPEIIDAIIDLRSIFPNSMINLVTNGTYVAKKLAVVEALKNVGHSCLTISNHEPNKSYSHKVKKTVLDMFDWKQSDVRLDWLETDNRFYLELRSASSFISPLSGNYGSVKPHYSDPEKAFTNCCFHGSLNYYQGKLYKCSPLQYLHRVLDDWGQHDDQEWQQYLDYRPLSLDCSNEEMIEFFSHVDRPESYCSMCPSQDMPDGKYTIRGQWKRPIIPIHPPK